MSDGGNLSDVAAYKAERIDSTRRHFRGRGVEITGICSRCNYSHIYSTPRANTPTVICARESSMRMPTDINECNKFSQQGRIDIWDLAKLATLIEIDSTKVGFKHKS